MTIWGRCWKISTGPFVLALFTFLGLVPTGLFYIITVMPKRVDHDMRRTQLADAAIMAIDTHGLDAVRLVDVAKAAKLTTGAVVHYLHNKDEVLLAAFDEVCARTLVRIGSTQGEDLIEQAMRYLPHDEETSREWRVFLQFWGRGVSDPVFRTRHKVAYETIADMLRLELEAKGLRDVAVLADAMIAAVDGVALRVAMEADAWPEARMRKTLATLLDPLIAAHMPK